MAKKTSRAARVQPTQTKRTPTARPLVTDSELGKLDATFTPTDTPGSVEGEAASAEAAATTEATSAEPVESVAKNALSYEYKPRTSSAAQPRPITATPTSSRATPGNAPRPTARPLPRRFVEPTQKAPALSRDEELRFIKADLRTVLILTVLMIALLVVLTIVLGR